MALNKTWKNTFKMPWRRDPQTCSFNWRQQALTMYDRLYDPKGSRIGTTGRSSCYWRSNCWYSQSKCPYGWQKSSYGRLYEQKCSPSPVGCSFPCANHRSNKDDRDDVTAIRNDPTAFLFLHRKSKLLLSDYFKRLCYLEIYIRLHLIAFWIWLNLVN